MLGLSEENYSGNDLRYEAGSGRVQRYETGSGSSQKGSGSDHRKRKKESILGKNNINQKSEPWIGYDWSGEGEGEVVT